MKKYFIMIAMVCGLSQLQAGFFSSLMGSVVANDLSGSASRAYISPSRAKHINGYLWDMHEAKKYNKEYVHYLKELEKSTKIGHQDTLAWVYYDHNNSKKAAEIYEKNILPWLRFENRRTIRSYENTYRKFTGLKGKIDYQSILEKYLPLEEDNATTKELPNVAELQVKIAELKTQNASLESYKMLTLIMGVITVLALGLVFVLLRRKNGRACLN